MQRTARRRLEGWGGGALALAAAMALAPRSSSAAEPAAQCEERHAIEGHQLLRRLSFDLRGRPPSLEEYEALEADGDIPIELVRNFVGSDDFRLTMRRFHDAMFWPEISNIDLSSNDQQLDKDADEPALFCHYTGATIFYRKGNENCGDYEQTHFERSRNWISRSASIRDATTCSRDSVRQSSLKQCGSAAASSRRLFVVPCGRSRTPTAEATVGWPSRLARPVSQPASRARVRR